MTATSVRNGSAPEAFRFVLRRSTAADHDALDGHPAFAALMSGRLSLDGYRRLMSLFHGFYQRHDPTIARSCEILRLDRFGFTYACRIGILERDLSALGATRTTATRPADLPGLAANGSAGTLAGVLYVLEGSTLGGGVLSRAVSQLLAGKGTGGGDYWLWCREVGGARWAMTCAMIEAVSRDETARDEMIAGARATFAAFADSLAPWQDGACGDEPVPGARSA